MKILNKKKFILEAGTPITHKRDLSLYDSAPYDCACGSTHSFNQYSSQLFGSTGASAKFIAQCPNNTNVATLIKTKNKFLVIFDRFISLAGCVADD